MKNENRKIKKKIEKMKIAINPLLIRQLIILNSLLIRRPYHTCKHFGICFLEPKSSNQKSRM